MSRFRKRKKSSNQVDSTFSIPRRTGRRIIGDMDEMLTRSELKGLESDTREIGNFHQTSGYHSARPAISEEFESQPNQTRQPSMLNKNLPGSAGHVPPLVKPVRKHKVRLRKRIAWTLTTFSAILVSVIVFLFAKGYLNLHKVFGGSNDTILATCPIDRLQKEGDCRINLVLMGIGGEGHDGPDLTDTILLVSIDPINHQAGLLSIPRDFWVSSPGYNPMKINALFENGKWKSLGQQSASNNNKQAVQAGFDLLNAKVNEILGLSIQKDVLVNFQAFQQMVSTLGGITFNVPTTLYDPTLSWANNSSPYIAQAGNQFFDGPKALLYVRSRETTSDFARSERQRQVIVAMKDKVLSLGTFSNPVKISQLIDEFGNNVHTNLTINEAQTLYGISKQISDTQIKSVGLADPPNNYVKTGVLGDQSIVSPTAGFYNYSAIQKFVRMTFRDGQLTRENANVMILNGSTQATLASQEAAVLRSYGYNVGVVDDNYAQKTSTTKLIDVSKGHNPFTKHYLENRLGVSATSKLSDTSVQIGNANFVIILGDNAAITSTN